MIKINFVQDHMGGVIGIGEIETINPEDLINFMKSEGQDTIISNKRIIHDDEWGSITITEIYDDGIFVEGNQSESRLVAEGISYWIAAIGEETSIFIKQICNGFELVNHSNL